jgi:formylglycine-generating enzyme required for sulfatase activity
VPRRLDWQQGAALAAIDRELAGQPPGKRHWYVTREGHTLALVHDPGVFAVDAPAGERDREDLEAPHRRLVPRSFALGTKEVTVAQFRRFLDANPAVRQSHHHLAHLSPDDDGPIIAVTWFEAAQYCIWLSRQEGFPEDRWCYPAIEQIGEGMELPRDYLHRTGYRLPTEAEWEFACRAGAATSRFFGSAEELLSEYAWYTKTTNDKRAWPGGQLKPNDLGLFDTYGNAVEWCQDVRRPYPVGEAGQVIADAEDETTRITDDYRVKRGGGFGYIAAMMRSASRDWDRPSGRSNQAGLRVARTI